MDSSIAGFLAADGVVNGAVYALMAIAIVLVFSVTRILFIAQGEFFVFGAASLYQLQNGTLPSAVWLLMGATILCAFQALGSGILARAPLRTVLGELTRVVAVPLLVTLVVFALRGQRCRRHLPSFKFGDHHAHRATPSSTGLPVAVHI